MRNNLTRAVQLAALGKDVVAMRRRSLGSRGAAQSRVVERLMRLHGLPQKIGQILSLGEVGQDSSVFMRLVETPAAMPASTAFAEIDRALGHSWRKCFQSLSPDGIGASLAQVHRGTLHDGREVAVKIQYPGIAEALELDLKALGWLTTPVGGLRKGFDLGAYRREIGQMLQLELDYRHEAEMIKRFAGVVAGVDRVEVPEVIEEHSNGRILTMTWMDGKPFADARRWPTEERRRIAEILLQLFVLSVFSVGVLHADPHPGNYRFNRIWRNASVGLLDFGCVKTLEPNVTRALYALIRDTIEGRLDGTAELARARFESLGFQSLLLMPMQSLLPELCRILFEPFLEDRPFDIKNWHLGSRVGDLLGEFRWNFRIAGPATLIYFMRAYQGLIQYLSALDVPVNWRTAYEKIDDQNCEDAPRVESIRPHVPTRSRVLRIRVTRAGRTKAELTFPAGAAESLSDLIPTDVEPKLISRNIDVSRMSQSLAENGFPPGDLFSLQEGQDDFHVWLE